MATQEVVVGNMQNLANGIGLLPGQLVRFATEADKVDSVLSRVKIVDGITLSNAGTLKKAITQALKDLDTSRKSFTEPLTNLAKLIKADFDVPSGRLETSKESLQKKMNAYVAAEEARLQAQAEADAKAQADAALALAESAQADGDVAGAEAILQQAEGVIAQPVKVRADTGAYGTIVVGQRVISGELPDKPSIRRFLSWAATELDENEILDITIGKRLLNSLAKEVDSDPGLKIPGLKVNVEKRAL